MSWSTAKSYRAFVISKNCQQPEGNVHNHLTVGEYSDTMIISEWESGAFIRTDPMHQWQNSPFGGYFVIFAARK
jgi:hypothetical protein